MQKSFRLFSILVLVLLVIGYVSLVIHAATPATVVVNATMRLHAISPYIFGHNSSAIYYKAPLTDPVMINYLKNAGLRMWRFPPGQAGNRYDFKGNNYAGRYWDGWSASWTTGSSVPSLEDELRFCNEIGAEPLVEINSAFRGPQGTGRDIVLRWVGGGDFSNYTGNASLPDTAENRAKYAADMVTHVRALCDANPAWTWLNGSKYPVYYEVGNEWAWDGQTYQSYVDCYREYYKAIKAVDPNAKVMNSGAGIGQVGTYDDIYDIHNYFAHYGRPYAHSVGIIDGSFASLSSMGGNQTKDIFDAYAVYAPDREIAYSFSEWGDFANGSEMHFAEYQGGMLMAHALYRFIKNDYLISCPWSIWGQSDNVYNMFGHAPVYTPNARYYPLVLYKNFGSTLLECYDITEYTPGVTDFFFDYKDDHDDLLTQASMRSDGNIAVMVTNLSQATTYQASINLDNFTMTGEVVSYVMNQANCDKSTVGPSSTTATGNTNPFTFEFKPFTVTCLIVKGATIPDSTVPAAVSQVRDGTGTDIENIYTTRILRANWAKTTDLQSGVSTYWYAVGTSAGGTNVLGWTDTKKLSAVVSGLNLSIGQRYYFSVKAQNGYGGQSALANSNGVFVAGDDTSGPVVSAVRDGTGSADIDVSYDSTKLRANWDAAVDPETLIVRYWYAIGTTPGAANVVNWSSTTLTNVTKDGLTLTLSSNYYFSIKAENDNGLMNVPVNSDGALYARGPMVFKDNFESWSTSKGAWDSVDASAGSVSTVTEQKNAGSKSLKCADTSASGKSSYLTKNIAGSAALYTQFYLYLPAGFLNSLNDGQQALVSVISSSGDKRLYLYAGKSDGVGTLMIQTNTGDWPNVFAHMTFDEARWYCIELCSPEASSSADFKCWVDGVEQGGIGADTTGGGNWNKIELGLVGGDSIESKTYTIYIDDLKMAGTYIGDLNDSTVPSNIAVIRDGTGETDVNANSNSLSVLSANWDGSVDVESGISRYWYSIGTTAGATDVVGWTDNGISRSVTRTGLSLQDGHMYYFGVKSENGMGLESSAINSDGQVAEYAPVVNTSTDTAISEIYPNPFSLQALKEGKGITFQLKSDTPGGNVMIYTISGKLVKKLTIPGQEYKVQWDGKNEDGEKVTRGIYIYKIGDNVTGKLAVK